MGRDLVSLSGFLLPESPRVISPLFDSVLGPLTLPHSRFQTCSLTQRPPVQFRQSTTSPRPSRVVWVVSLCPFYVFKSTSTSVTVWNNNQHYLSVESRTYYQISKNHAPTGSESAIFSFTPVPFRTTDDHALRVAGACGDRSRFRDITLLPCGGLLHQTQPKQHDG